MKIQDGIFNKKKLNDLLVYGVGQAVNLIGPILVMPYLIAVCGEEGLGKIGVGFALALILNGIVDYGSYITGVKEISINRDNAAFLENRFKAIYVSKLLLLLMVTAVSTLLFFFVPFFSVDKPLFFLSLAIVLGQFLNPAWFFQGTENFKWISATNILSKAIYIAGVYLYVTKTEDYIFANLFFGLGAIIANAIGLFFAFRRYSFSFGNFRLQPAIAILRDEFSFSVSQFFLSVYQFFPIMIISYVGGNFIAGQYRIIDQIVGIFKSYLNIFFYFVYANVCYEINKDIRKGLLVWKQFNGLNFLFLLTVLAVFYWQTEFLFTCFKIAPERIPELSHYFRLGLLIPLLISISLPLRQLMFAFDKNQVYIIITIAATLFNVVLLWFLTVYFGLAGSFLSIIIIESIVIILYCFILKDYFTKPLKQV